MEAWEKATLPDGVNIWGNLTAEELLYLARCVNANKQAFAVNGDIPLPVGTATVLLLGKLLRLREDLTCPTL